MTMRKPNTDKPEIQNSSEKAIENIWTQIGSHFSKNRIGPADVDRVILEVRNKRRNALSG